MTHPLSHCTMKRIALLLLALGVVACDKSSTGSGPQVGSVIVTPDNAGVGVNDTVHLSVQVRDANNQPVTRTVTWRSLNGSIASVDGNGVVRGLAAGTAQIEASTGGKADTATIVVVAGPVRRFNVNANVGCSSPIMKSAQLVASTPRVAIYEDLTNPGGGPTQAQYQNVAQTVESLVYDMSVANFGAPTDIDNNGRVIILYTRAVNELTPPNVNWFVGGFAYARDLFPKTATGNLGACPASNVAEMFYMLAADPGGVVNGNVRSVSFVLDRTVGTVSHELQHVINASRRLYVVPGATGSWEETVWLNEGLSHIAEELTFYAATGRGPRQNISLPDVATGTPDGAAFISYGIANIDRFDSYLSAPAAYGPYMTNDDLETRGAIWALMRYGADRRGGNDQQLWFSLVNTALRGLPNLEAGYGINPMTLARDFTVANYTDDAVAGVSAIYRHPSWNFRSITTSPRYGGYPLPVTPLAAGATSSATIRAGSAAYFRFGVAPGGTADVRVAAGGTTVGGACTAVTLAAGQVFHGTPDNASAVCLAGGVTGAEYVLIPFYGAPDANGISANGTTSVSVVATGIIAPSGPPTPDYATVQAGAGLLGARAPGDGGFEARLRRREREELRGLTPEVAPAPGVGMDPAAPGVQISYVRIR